MNSVGYKNTVRVAKDRGTVRLMGMIAAVLGIGATGWFGVALWGKAAGWNAAKVHAAVEGGWWIGGVAAAVLAARLLCLTLDADCDGRDHDRS